MTQRGAARREPARHDLLWLTVSGWQALAGSQPAICGTAGMQFWAAQDLPVMRRRKQPGDSPGLIPVAITLPNTFGRARLGFEIAPQDVARSERPPALHAVAPGLPDRLQPRAERVLAMADAVGLMPCVFGSATWQHVTGQPYLHAQSDLDLLWNIPPGAESAALVTRLIALLCTLDAEPGPRLDGEVILDGIRAANWRELRPEVNGDVLVKTAEEVILMSRELFMWPAVVSC